MLDLHLICWGFLHDLDGCSFYWRCFLVVQGTLVVSDCLNHMSIVSGCRAAGAHIRVFKHNDAEDLAAVSIGRSASCIVLNCFILSWGNYFELKNHSKREKYFLT